MHRTKVTTISGVQLCDKTAALNRHLLLTLISQHCSSSSSY